MTINHQKCCLKSGFKKVLRSTVKTRVEESTFLTYTGFLWELEPLKTKIIVVYYESIKREVKRRLIYEYRCDERQKTKKEESTLLVDTGLVVELEHLKTKTRLIDEKFSSVRGECETSMR